ncbi:LPS export ABC transporter permease LptF [Caldimonas tepidiphila]|uniref:LPS export ABC transporter permease LptF n=1 Tax=Caldimonas tepidiphila TaxID=2315841 RepID=UPI000E5B2601|nr:LPS export ABC transporter permease LptF [Caldimonas tepidiphila]
MLFDSSLRRELARSFGATLAILLTIVMTMMLIRMLGQAASGAVAPQHVVLLMGFTVLGHLPTLLSLSLFVAVVSTLSRMYRDSEMTIWFASGLALRRFVRPVARLAWPVVLGVGLLSLFAWPWSHRYIAELRQLYEQRSDLSRVAPGQFQSSRDGRRVFFIERNTDDGSTGRNVFILTSEGERESVTSARSGRLETVGDDRVLVLDKGQRVDLDLASGERRIARFETYRIVVGEHTQAGADNRPPRARSTPELLREPTPRHLGELVWRLGAPLTAINLMVLGLGLAATNPRRGSSWNLILALLTFVVYFNLLNLSQAWVASERLGPLTALALVHGGMALLAWGLLWWRDGDLRLRRGARGAAA